MMKLQLLLNKVKYINLYKIEFLVKWKKKIIYKIIKNTLNSKNINFYHIQDINNDLIKFHVKKNKRYYIII